MLSVSHKKVRVAETLQGREKRWPAAIICPKYSYKHNYKLLLPSMSQIIINVVTLTPRFELLLDQVWGGYMLFMVPLHWIICWQNRFLNPIHNHPN